MSDYVIVRLGLSTGTCAAAAAKAAVLAALGLIVRKVVVPTPIGLRVEVPVVYAKRTGDRSGEAGVVKDAGDDRENDVTHGIMIIAEAELTESGTVEITGGPGVGIVTEPGLPVPPGEYAINPVPRRQIAEAVREALPHGLGARIRIRVPDGEEIAKLTMNPELGIVGGISILGTTGLVIPYSHRAFIQSLATHLKHLRALGESLVIIVTGHDAKRVLVEKYGVKSKLIVIAGDYIPQALKLAENQGFNYALIVAKPAKALKLAVGAINTSSDIVDARIEALVYHMLRAGLDLDKIRHAITASSVSEVLSLLHPDDVRRVLRSVAEAMSKQLSRRVSKITVRSAVLYGSELIGDNDFYNMLSRVTVRQRE